jgi:hypothetical protein
VMTMTTMTMTTCHCWHCSGSQGWWRRNGAPGLL